MEWQPIETAPKDGRPLLLVTASGFVGIGNRYVESFDGLTLMNDQGAFIGQRTGDEKIRVFMPSSSWSDVTHWMPLPEAPK